MTVDVYSQYFSARAVCSGVERRAALVSLVSDSDHGLIRYEVLVSLFPHVSEDDFAVSYDACATREIYCARGRRSKKREQTLLADLRGHADGLAASLGGTICWEMPLREARYG